MGLRSAVLSSAVLCLAACGESTINQSDGDETETGPVTIYTGGPIYTGLDDKPTVEAVAVSGKTILATGTRALIEDAAGDDVTIVDLNGAAMYPGFTDAHAHLIGIGMRELTLNLEGVGSLAALVEKIEAAVAGAADGDVIYGRGWIETGWPEARMPTRDDLDPVSGDHEVFLVRADGHALVANTAALAAAGINDETPDPDGGKIERDDTGRATGILIDNAQLPVEALIAAPDEATKRKAYEEASRVYTAYGWTGLHNVSVNPANVPLMESLSDDGKLALRVYNSVDQAGLAELEAGRAQTNENERIHTNAIKLYFDGALGSRGALLTEPYSDRPDTSGLLLMQKDDAIAVFERALAAGVQVNSHAIGDEGNHLLLNWYEEVLTNAPSGADPRWRIEHAQILHTEDIPRFAELGVIPSMQPSHAIGDLFFAPDRLGPDRLDGAYPWRSLIDAGAIIAGGSDAPVERGDPRIEFYAAVARRGLNGYQDDNWRPDQAVTRAEALKMFTLWPAYASFAEDRLGVIAPGMRADFTVFADDIMTIPAEEILTTETVMTIIDGEIAYQR